MKAKMRPFFVISLERPSPFILCELPVFVCVFCCTFEHIAIDRADVRNPLCNGGRGSWLTPRRREWYNRTRCIRFVSCDFLHAYPFLSPAVLPSYTLTNVGGNGQHDVAYVSSRVCVEKEG